MPWVICKSCNLVARVFGFDDNFEVQESGLGLACTFPPPLPTTRAPTTKQAPQGLLAGVQNVFQLPSRVHPPAVQQAWV